MPRAMRLEILGPPSKKISAFIIQALYASYIALSPHPRGLGLYWVGTRFLPPYAETLLAYMYNPHTAIRVDPPYRVAECGSSAQRMVDPPAPRRSPKRKAEPRYHVPPLADPWRYWGPAVRGDAAADRAKL